MATDLKDALRLIGASDLISVAQDGNLRPIGLRFECPLPACDSFRGSGKRSVGVFEHGRGETIYRWKCHRCTGGGTYVDLLIAVDGLSQNEAIAKVCGRDYAPHERARVVRMSPKERPAERPDKMRPDEIRALWDQMAATDPVGLEYLDTRRLGGSGLVKYATGEHPDDRVARQGRRGYRIGMLVKDVLGEPRGIQLRFAGDSPPERDGRKGPKILSVKGSSTATAFFGKPEKIETEEIICVTEGMADTMAVEFWCEGKMPVVGVAGINNLRNLVDELVACGIGLSGKCFALFCQNDQPKNLSRIEFDKFAREIAARGAFVIWCNTDLLHTDVADWWQSAANLADGGSAPHWPHEEIQKYIENGIRVGDDNSPGERCDGDYAVRPLVEYRVGAPDKSFSTLLSVLDNPVARGNICGTQDPFAKCEMTDRVILSGKQILETDLSGIRAGIEEYTRVAWSGERYRWSEDDIWRAVNILARRKPTHPVRDWLTSLKWDGTPRIEEGLPGALGIGKNTIAARLIKRWMVSAVARPLKPGFKVDTVLVVVGKQGIGKSRFFATMGGEWFCDSPIDIGSKDAPMILRESWIVEWPELESMRKKEAEAIKAFLSQPWDKYRPPYGRVVIKVPRTCVIVGTTNNDQFLADESGSRRFWTIQATAVDLAWVEAAREQLWAEAVHLHSQGERCWLSDMESRMLAESNAEFDITDADPWIPKVRAWLMEKDKTEVTSHEVLNEAIERPVERQTRYDTIRIGHVMRKLGWARSRPRLRSGPRAYRYTKPGTEPTQ